ncbi:MAG TPA: hypothetical protein PLW44_06470, partial [Chitinophagales bacterium]|nr:hypothetical protein [Chitinophagales bacterium]
TGSALCYGIWAGSGSAYTVDISGNTIQNLATSNVGAGTTSQVIGINTSAGGLYSVDNNTIKFLTTNSQNVNATTISVAGIYAVSANTQAHSVSGNTIYGLSNTSAVNATVAGIYFTGNSSAVSHIAKNFIYNLRSGSGTASVVNGIYIGTGYTQVSNNRIRLGYDEAGAAITNTSVIAGIVKDNTTANNSVYYNSVYIGGTGVGSTANNTYAFRRIQTGATDNVRNNIFVNARANATTGGKHYGVYLNNTTTLTQDYNLIYTTGTGTVFGFDGTTDRADIAAWKANTAFDDNSVSADPQFEDPTNGTTPNLKLKTNVATPAESGAVAIAGLTDDFETANVRTGYPLGLPQGGTAPDMGADEANLIPQDMVAPVFTYTNIPTQAVCGTTTTTVQVTITDGQSGISLSANKPRMYFRRSVGAPTTSFNATDFVEGTYVSGTTNASIWSFTLNYAAFGITPAASNSFEYYFVAQDLSSTPNVGYSQSNGTTPVHAPGVSGGTTLTFPGFTLPASGTFSFTSIAPLSGTVSVGTGQTYTTFNGASGLFAAINTSGLSGNLVVNVTSDITETTTTGLNQVAYYCGGPYTITIQPSTNAIRTISAAITTALIQFNGADNIVVEGNSGGSGRYLRFRNTNTTTGSVFQMQNDATNITIQNCDIQGQGTSTTSSTVIAIGTAASAGNSNITINSNL